MVKITLVCGSELVLPVTPEEIKVDSGQVVNKFYNYWKGYAVKPSHLKPKILSIASFFPVRKGNGDDHIIGSILGLDCVKMIEAWRSANQKVRVIIAELNIDTMCCIEEFSYVLKRSGDISYSLSMCEVTG